MRNIIKIFLLTVAPLLTACETDSYRTGDGALSAMRAEFVEAHTDADARVMAVETDGGERLTLTSPVVVGWMEKPDTVYRALFYYNKVDGDGGQPQAEPVAVSYVLVPSVAAAAANFALAHGCFDFLMTEGIVIFELVNTCIGIEADAGLFDYLLGLSVSTLSRYAPLFHGLHEGTLGVQAFLK